MIVDMNVGHTPTQTRSDRAKTMVEDLRRLGVPASIGKLEFGDVSFSGYGPSGPVQVGIELKTVGGLLTDMTTGRFAGHQVGGMQRAYPYRYLIVEGLSRPSNDGMLEVLRGKGVWHSPPPRIMYIDYLKYLDDVELRGGFHVKRSSGRYDTLCHIAAEYRGWTKAWDSHKGLKVFNEASAAGVVLLREPSLLRLWAKDLPNIGWERSESIERHFRSPLAMAQAGEIEWQTIPGIGKTIASRVWKAIRGLK